MKNNFKYRFELYKQSLNTQKFMLVFALSIIFAIYGVLALGFMDDYITGFVNVFTGSIYVAGVLLILLLNTSNLLSIFESNQFYIIRFKTRKEYLVELIKTVLFSNLCTLLLNVILVVIGLNIFNKYNSSVTVMGYNMSPWIYIIYMIIKFIILSSIISIITVLLFKILNKKIVIVLNIILYIFIAATPYSATTINSIINIPLFIGTYFMKAAYSNFLFEILCFLLYSSVLIIIIEVVKNITLKRMKDVSQ